MRRSARFLLFIVFIFTFIVASVPRVAVASGTYRWGTPRPPRRAFDVQKYQRGRAIFLWQTDALREIARVREASKLERRPTGGIVDPEIDVFEQRLRLMELEGQLEKSEQGTVRLVDMAGELTDAQVLALKYFLYTRSGVPDTFDSGRYVLGDRLLSRRVNLAEVDEQLREPQKKKLRELADRLGQKERETADLTNLQGRLRAPQLDALEYFIAIRHHLDKSFDAGKYHLGERVFGGQLSGDPGSPDSVARWLGRLRELQTRLPVRVRRRHDLALLAGRLNEKQFEQLLYFLKVRFKVTGPCEPQG